jgi:hypothetical protein
LQYIDGFILKVEIHNRSWKRGINHNKDIPKKGKLSTISTVDPGPNLTIEKWFKRRKKIHSEESSLLQHFKIPSNSLLKTAPTLIIHQLSTTCPNNCIYSLNKYNENHLYYQINEAIYYTIVGMSFCHFVIYPSNLGFLLFLDGRLSSGLSSCAPVARVKGGIGCLFLLISIIFVSRWILRRFICSKISKVVLTLFPGRSFLTRKCRPITLGQDFIWRTHVLFFTFDMDL